MSQYRWNRESLLSLRGGLCRPRFRWKDADEIYIGAGGYVIRGTVNKYVFWESELTFQLGSGGSNSSSDDVAEGWMYIFIDDSSFSKDIVELGVENFRSETTAPTWDAAKQGWYTGGDRCIFATLADSNPNILEFNHDGGECVQHAAGISEASAFDVDTVWLDVDCKTSVPGFSTKAAVHFQTDANGDTSAAISYWRTNSQTDTTGHRVGWVDSGVQELAFSTTEIITDGAQIFEVKMSSSGTYRITILTDGWYFPQGM